MANTFIKISSVTVGSGGAATISFTSIPQTYTDLKLVISARSTRATNADDMILTLNSSTANFTGKYLNGNGSNGNTGTFLRFAGTIPGTSSSASVFGNGELYIPNYASSNFKSYRVDSVSENNGVEAYQMMIAGLWSDTAAITSVGLSSNNGANFAEYSTATLYGIKSS